MTYRIGQVIFYLLRNEGKLKPARVVEEVIRKTMKGSETVYMVQFSDQQDLIQLDTLKGDIFSTAEEAYLKLSERSNVAIKRLIDSATIKAKQYFPDVSFEKEQIEDDVPYVGEEHQTTTNMPNQMIEGPDGQMMLVRSVQLPDSLK